MRLDEQEGKCCQDSVEECLAGDEQCAVEWCELLDDDAVDGPAEGSEQGEEVAEGVDAQSEATVENHKPHSDEGYSRSENGGFARTFRAVEEANEQHREKRRERCD